MSPQEGESAKTRFLRHRVPLESIDRKEGVLAGHVRRLRRARRYRTITKNRLSGLGQRGSPLSLREMDGVRGFKAKGRHTHSHRGLASLGRNPRRRRSSGSGNAV
jgi:hypothetical protein